VFESEACPATLLDLATAEQVVEYEASEGKIREFWQRHFEDNMDKINGDHLARRIVLHLADRVGQELTYKEVAQALGVEQQPVLDRLQLLEEADLIESVAFGVYNGVRDRMLMRHIQLSLRPDVEGVPREQVTAQLAQQLHEEVQQIGALLRSMEGGLNYYLGRYSEIFVENVMHRFDGREVESSRFFLGRTGILRLPDFAEVYPTRTQMVSARGYQVDLFGWYAEGPATHGWAVEVRNREEAFGLEDVETFLGALESLRKEHLLDALQGWVHARGGFTAEAQARLLAEGVLLTTLEGLRALVHEFHVA
jgi:DNA-binding Lrp family transcriptional regulator